MSLMSAEMTTTVRIDGFGPPDQVSVDVDVDDVPYRVVLEQPRGMDAARWAALDDFQGLFPGALDDDQAAYWSERLADADDPLTLGAVRVIAYAVAKPLYGMDWWAAHRLCSRAAANWWQYEAWTVSKGFDPRTAPAARIAASCWAWAVSGCEKDDDVAALQREVFTAPGGMGHEARLARSRAMAARLAQGRSG